MMTVGPQELCLATWGGLWGTKRVYRAGAKPASEGPTPHPHLSSGTAVLYPAPQYIQHAHNLEVNSQFQICKPKNQRNTSDSHCDEDIKLDFIW